MDLFLRIDINIVAMILLSIIFFIAYRGLDKNDKLNEIFLNVSLIIILEILFETLTCVINGNNNSELVPITIFLHMCLFITGPFLTYFWYAFVHYWVTSKSTIPIKSKIILLIPVAVNLIITILSPFYNFVFYIDSFNIYHRGSLFWLSSAIVYFYIFLGFIIVIKNKKKILKEDFLPIIIFGIFPSIGGLFQSLFYGTLLMWSSCAFSLMIVYNYLQQRMIRLDNLSGVWTRGSFDYFINRRAKLYNAQTFGVIFADIDGLKDINDRFGHMEGDNAIKNLIKIMKSVLRKTDIIARFGGDEFVVVLDCDSKDDLDRTIDRIKQSLDKYNQDSGMGYFLECSFGADVFGAEQKSIDQFLYHVDSLMYSNKKQKKVG